MRIRALVALALLIPGAALADPPPSVAPAYRPNVSLQPVTIYDANGNPVSAFGGPGGSTGTDSSVNAATVSGTPLVTIPVNQSRAYVEVQNQSASQLQIVRDDGAGNNVTSILLAPGGANQQGGGWSSGTFKGRVRVYAPAGSQVAAYQD